MLARLSSKGQLVIPLTVRRDLNLAPGTQFRVQVVEQKIILEPVAAASPIDALYGRFAGHDLLGDLEREHQREIENDRTVRS